MFTTNLHPIPPKADPAHPEPATARAEGRDASAGRKVADHTDYYLRSMREMAALCMATAQRLAVEAAPDVAAAGLQHLSRIIRLNATLSDKLQRGLRERDKEATAAVESATRERKTRYRAHVGRLVEQAIERHIERESERLADEDVELDLDRCPISAMVGRLCRDMGFEPDWALWDGQFWMVDAGDRPEPPSG